MTADRSAFVCQILDNFCGLDGFLGEIRLRLLVKKRRRRPRQMRHLSKGQRRLQRRVLARHRRRVGKFGALVGLSYRETVRRPARALQRFRDALVDLAYAPKPILLLGLSEPSDDVLDELARMIVDATVAEIGND